MDGEWPLVRFSKWAFRMAMNCGLFTIAYPLASSWMTVLCNSGAPKQKRSMPSSIDVPKSLSSTAANNVCWFTELNTWLILIRRSHRYWPPLLMAATDPSRHRGHLNHLQRLLFWPKFSSDSHHSPAIGGIRRLYCDPTAPPTRPDGTSYKRHSYFWLSIWTKMWSAICSRCVHSLQVIFSGQQPLAAWTVTVEHLCPSNGWKKETIE